MEFYKKLSSAYDLMTRFDDRYQNEEKMLHLWHQKLKIKSAMDVACGTGLHAILLSKMGVRTTGVDVSLEMLQQAKENAKRLGVSIPWIQSSMQNLKQHVQSGFEVLFCLGNSIPHLLTEKELELALQGFYAILNPNGFVVLQLLNYEKILKQKERIVGVHRKGNMEFVRFYDFLENQIQFNILKITDQNGKLSYDLSQTELFPYCSNDLKKKLKETGFAKLQFYGNMKMQDFESNSSENLVVLATKKE